MGVRLLTLPVIAEPALLMKYHHGYSVRFGLCTYIATSVVSLSPLATCTGHCNANICINIGE